MLVKRLLLVCTFIICSASFAQDAQQIEKLRNSDYEEAKEFAFNLATSGVGWELVDESSTDRALTFTFIEKSISEEKMRAVKAGKVSSRNLNTLIVKYTVFYQGENKNLEQAGIKRYNFYYVSGRYLDLFPLWKKVFKNNADLNLTPNDYDMQSSKGQKYTYKFSEHDAPYWLLERFY